MLNPLYVRFASRLSLAISLALAAGLLLLSLSVRAQELPGFNEVQAGMSAQDVESLMGKPDVIYWDYANGLSFEFHDGQVTFIFHRYTRADTGMRPAEVEAIEGQPTSVRYVFELPNWRRAIVELSGSRVVGKWFDEVRPPLRPLP